MCVWGGSTEFNNLHFIGGGEREGGGQTEKGEGGSEAKIIKRKNCSKRVFDNLANFLSISPKPNEVFAVCLPGPNWTFLLFVFQSLQSL